MKITSWQPGRRGGTRCAAAVAQHLNFLQDRGPIAAFRGFRRPLWLLYFAAPNLRSSSLTRELQLRKLPPRDSPQTQNPSTRDPKPIHPRSTTPKPYLQNPELETHIPKLFLNPDSADQLGNAGKQHCVIPKL